VKLVVFDLDGTITRHDTLLPYVLGFLRERPWNLTGLLRVLPVLLDFALGRADHGQLKSALIQGTLGGSSRRELESWTARFVPQLRSGGLFREALEQIARHKRQGDRLVLMSASTDLYVPRIGRELGFADIVCTELRWVGDRLSGELVSPNRRGSEKAACLKALRQRYPGLRTLAYGNAASDLEHLKLADEGILVNGSRRARREAQRSGITCVQWA
jgi:HAD superfamily hydrolase (TIGR01490 family)